MKTLLINNHSMHTEALASLFSNVTVVNREEITEDFDETDYDLIVMSGGSGPKAPPVLQYPEEYIHLANLVRRTNIPILGVCMGMQIIAVAFDGEIEELSKKCKGVVDLEITDLNLKKILGTSNTKAKTAHQFGIKTLPKDFVSCANSDHGIAIIKHKSKPIVGVQFHPEISNNEAIIQWIMRELTKNPK